MITIYKYQLRVFDTDIDLPVGCEIIHFGMQTVPSSYEQADYQKAFMIWCRVDTDAPTEPVSLLVLGTGHEIPPNHNYVGTVMGEPFVWHLFRYTGPRQ